MICTNRQSPITDKEAVKVANPATEDEEPSQRKRRLNKKKEKKNHQLDLVHKENTEKTINNQLVKCKLKIKIYALKGKRKYSN